MLKRLKGLVERVFKTPQIARSLHDIRRSQTWQASLEATKFRATLMDSSRYADQKRLPGFGYRVYSQNDEDGILAEIFRRIGVTSGRFCEIGVETGVECNTVYLLAQGWTGVWVEKRDEYVRVIQRQCRTYLEEGRLSVEPTFASPDNINAILERNKRADEWDLLSIDIDSDDLWLWRAVSTCRPRVVVIEYNALWVPPMAVTIPYASTTSWDGTNYFGASLQALQYLGSEKGYNLVGCCLAGVNAFFVRRDLCGDKFAAPFTAENHYEPFRPFLVGQPIGYPAGFGSLVTVDSEGSPVATTRRPVHKSIQFG